MLTSYRVLVRKAQVPDRLILVPPWGAPCLDFEAWESMNAMKLLDPLRDQENSE
jgi:hypothetical protein